MGIITNFILNDEPKKFTIVSSPVVTVAENQTLAITLNVQDAIGTVTYSISGEDSEAFHIDSVTGEITFELEPDYETQNSYTFIVNAIDSEGNQATQSVTIYISNVNEAPDTTKPVITLLGDATVTLTVGDTYSDAGATALDDKDGDITSQIVTTGSVDTSTVGTYTITYSVTDAAGNTADTVTRTVSVNEENAPAPLIDPNFTIDLTQVPSYDPNDPIEDQYLSVVNYLRDLKVKCNDPAGLEGSVGSDLVWNTFLMDAAQEHSDDMLANQLFSHQGSGTETDLTGQNFTPVRPSEFYERIEFNGYINYTTSGENIAMQGAYPTLSDTTWVKAMEGWMTSTTGHCSNIMNPNFKDFGMAEARGTQPYTLDDGTVIDMPVAYQTQNFGAQ